MKTTALARHLRRFGCGFVKPKPAGRLHAKWVRFRLSRVRMRSVNNQPPPFHKRTLIEAGATGASSAYWKKENDARVRGKGGKWSDTSGSGVVSRSFPLVRLAVPGAGHAWATGGDVRPPL